jgi:hypothetical protein
MGRVAMLSFFGVAELFSGALVRATTGAENAIGNVMRTMVTAHGR